MTNQEEPQYPEVYKVIGAPGTGKTTRVVGNPELELDGLFIENGDTYSLDEQMLVTYTNAGVDEAADRLSKMLDAPQYKIDERVTTIHSQCYSTLNEFSGFDGLDREQVVDHWNKKNFCDANGLDFGWEDDEDDIMGADMEQGNALFRIYDWLQNNRVSIEDWEECPAEWTWNENPQELLNKWEMWKRERNLIGFGDMIEKVVELGRKQVTNLGWGPLFVDDDMSSMELFKKARSDPTREPDKIRGKGAFIDTKVLYVDEVQDLTPLQWCWYLLQKLACEKVYIGGDDDQTIYGWAGANPEFMLGEEGDFEVLDRTYRIPRKVWETCDGVIQQVENRQEKAVEPDGDGGDVVTMRAPSARQVIEHIDSDDVMILFRARYQIDEFRNDLHEYGIPYDNMSTFDTWSDDIVKLRDGLAKVENGAVNINGDELRAMLEYAEDHMVRDGHGLSEKEKVMGQFGGISMDRLDEIFMVRGPYGSHDLTAKNFLSESEEINYYEKEAILGNIRSGNEDLYPDRVRIGTIHSSKGKEAETVILALDSTRTILDNMAEESIGEDKPLTGPVPLTDAERRVYYVGMTRASNKLVLAQGVVDPEVCIDLNQLLAEESKAGDWESQQQTFGAEFN